MKCETIKEANRILFQRYLDILNGYTKCPDNEDIVLVKKMCKAVLTSDMLEDKESRWLGFVQGILYMYNLVEVDEERDFSRPLFHSAYENMGIDIPESINLKDSDV